MTTKLISIIAEAENIIEHYRQYESGLQQVYDDLRLVDDTLGKRNFKY